MSVLLGVWAVVPWLDRRARHGKDSPAFTDLGVAALLFVGFLTLKAWDIGGGGAVQPDAHSVARACAIWILVVGLVANGLRFALLHQTWFILSGAALLHAALHGFFGMSYIAAGAVALIAAVAGVALTRRRLGLAGDPP